MRVITPIQDQREQERLKQAESIQMVLPSFEESELLEKEKQLELVKLINPEEERHVECLYRATRDGFGTRTFHERCDNRGPTVAIVQAQNHVVFGAYTDIDWKSPKTETRVPGSGNSFMFRFNYDGELEVLKCLDKQHEVYHGRDTYIAFGKDFLSLKDRTEGMYNRESASYEVPNVVEADEDLVGGLSEFAFFELEVFGVQAGMSAERSKLKAIQPLQRPRQQVELYEPKPQQTLMREQYDEFLEEKLDNEMPSDFEDQQKRLAAIEYEQPKFENKQEQKEHGQDDEDKEGLNEEKMRKAKYDKALQLIDEARHPVQLF